jgi:hypothetical protein
VRLLHRAGLDGAVLLRVYTMAGDRVRGTSFAEALVHAAQRAGLRGATVVPGLAGFGRHGADVSLTVQLYRPERQPMVVELVDAPERVAAFLRDEVAPRNRWDRLVTLERLRIHAYHASDAQAE